MPTPVSSPVIDPLLPMPVKTAAPVAPSTDPFAGMDPVDMQKALMDLQQRYGGAGGPQGMQGPSWGPEYGPAPTQRNGAPYDDAMQRSMMARAGSIGYDQAGVPSWTPQGSNPKVNDFMRWKLGETGYQDLIRTNQDAARKQYDLYGKYNETGGR